MFINLKITALSFALALCCYAVDPVPENPKVYVNNVGGFGSYLAAAFRVPAPTMAGSKQTRLAATQPFETIRLHDGRSNQPAAREINGGRWLDSPRATLQEMKKSYARQRPW
jgi:hypothetical protein